MQRIEINIDGDKIHLNTPYHSDLPPKAKQLGGKWNERAWTFAARDLELVRALCREIWGADDTDDGAETVRLCCVREKMAKQAGMTLCGVPLARAFGRDGGAKLEQDVVVIAGHGFGSGGSRANWYTTASVDTVFELRNLPRGTAAKLRAWCRSDNPRTSFVVKEANSSDARETLRSALQAERDRLTARLREIEAEMETVNQESFM